MKPKKTVIIKVEGGRVDLVGLPPGVELIAFDYDVDGEPVEDLKTDDDGRPYLRLEWS